MSLLSEIGHLRLKPTTPLLASEYRGLPFFEQQDVSLLRILTDREIQTHYQASI